MLNLIDTEVKQSVYKVTIKTWIQLEHFVTLLHL